MFFVVLAVTVAPVVSWVTKICRATRTTIKFYSFVFRFSGYLVDKQQNLCATDLVTKTIPSVIFQDFPRMHGIVVVISS